MNVTSEIAKKAYDAYRKVAQKTFLQVTTAQLNIIYNILCRINRDSEYAAALEELDTVEKEPLKVLIEKYFEGYNNLHGLDIRETLTEFTDPDFAEGGFFVIETFKKGENGELTEWRPTDFTKGDEVLARATVCSHSENTPVKVARLSATSVSDDGVTVTTDAYDTSAIDFTFTLSREGMVKFKVVAMDASDSAILGFETAYGGVLFSREEIRPTHKPPEDLVAFWCSEIDRMMATDPTDTKPSGYSGDVEYLYDMPAKNRYELVKLDLSYLDMMKKNAQPTVADTVLEKFDIWDVSLKSPGPCPSTAYISVPKHASPSSLPIKFIFDGYGVRCPAPMIAENAICVHCSHHGYELGKEDASYYAPLRESICANYGRGNGKPNSGYENVHDCYMTYLLIRDLQMVRYSTDPSASYDLPELHEKWNGEVIISGGSMGGYQTVCVGALTTLLRKVSAPFKVVKLAPNIPAFCNIAGHTDGRIKPGITTYEEGCDYFDAALLAHLIDAPTAVTRAGLGDETCPATGITAMFNSIPSGIPKEISYLQNSSHGYLPDVEFQSWYNYKY